MLYTRLMNCLHYFEAKETIAKIYIYGSNICLLTPTLCQTRIRLWGHRETQQWSTCKEYLVGEETLQSPLLMPYDPCRVITSELIGRKTSQGRCPWVVHCKVNESLFGVEWSVRRWPAVFISRFVKVRVFHPGGGAEPICDHRWFQGGVGRHPHCSQGCPGVCTTSSSIGTLRPALGMFPRHGNTGTFPLHLAKLELVLETQRPPQPGGPCCPSGMLPRRRPIKQLLPSSAFHHPPSKAHSRVLTKQFCIHQLLNAVSGSSPSCEKPEEWSSLTKHLFKS